MGDFKTGMGVYIVEKSSSTIEIINQIIKKANKQVRFDNDNKILNLVIN